MNSNNAFGSNERPYSGGPYYERNPYGPAREIRPLLPDEQELWSNCVSSGFFKYIHPKKANKPLSSPLKQTIHFGLNCFLGTILYSPVCFGKLQQRIFQNDQKIRQMKLDGVTPSLGSKNISENDVSSESNLEPKLDEPESSFSHLNMDFVSPMETLKFEEEMKTENTPKVPETTYDELRRRNRYNYKRQELLSLYDFDRPKPSSSNFPEREPEKIVPPKPKNKYGDEME